MKVKHKFEQYVVVIAYHNNEWFANELGITRQFFNTYQEAYNAMILESTKYKGKIIDEEYLDDYSAFSKYKRPDGSEWSMCVEIIDCSVESVVTIGVE